MTEQLAQRQYAEPLTMNDYQHTAGSTAVYPGQGAMGGLMYATLGLTGEAGEIANKVKKIHRDKGGVLDAADRTSIAKELGDVLWYVAQLAFELGYSLDDVATANLEKLAARANAGTLQGSGDDR